jgi:hypothetical protein
MSNLKSLLETELCRFTGGVPERQSALETSGQLGYVWSFDKRS